ncbi:LINE-1 retrotransposable element ORF2 protein [Dictyocoela muelleri]|nr:LINE-1 retrotransposable element ORF2 protein [Dictyocoela muelleri]
MGSDFSNETPEKKKLRKMLRTGAKTTLNNTISNTITNTRKKMKETIDCEGLLNLIAENQNNEGRIRRGGWAKITAHYNLKNKTNFNQTSIRNFYIRFLKENLINNDKNIDSKTNSENERNNDEIEINNDDSQKTKVDWENRNNKKMITNELNYLTKELKNIYTGLNIEDLITWKPTPRISSLILNRKLLREIDDAVNILIVQEKISDICDIVKVIYSAQLIYSEKIKKPVKKTNWIENINKKIDRLSYEKEVVNKYLNNDSLDKILQKEFNYICSKRKIKKSETEKGVTKDDLREIIFKIENEILLYNKRLDVHFNKKKYLKDNFLYECNRKKFYRQLSAENKQIIINTDKDSILKFWETQFCQLPQTETNDMKKIIKDTLKPIENLLDVNLDENMINSTIDTLPNWKATGIDKVYNFFIKNLKSVRKPLIREIQRLCANPSLIPEIFFYTITYMIPKKNDPNPSEFRPISCMSNIYKLITKVLTQNLYNILDINEVISFNQIGVRKNTMASKEQLLFNHSINVVNDFKLKTVWFDIQKAYDSVPFEYVNEILINLNLPLNYVELMKKLQKEIKMNIVINNESIGTIKPCRGIIQGDSLSPLIFTLCMEPISRILNQNNSPKVEIKYKDSEFAINHLLYMDDLKIFATDDEKLKYLTEEFTNTISKIGMNHNKSKSATNSPSISDIADIISPLNGYKYLGLLEDSDNKFKDVNIDIISKRINERIKKICQTSLNAKNMFNSFNEFALCLLNYFVGTVNMPENTLANYDTEIRKILIENNIHNKTACKERLYLKRKNMGRGLNSLEFIHDKLLYNILKKIESKSHSCIRNKLIKSVYENFSISLSELEEKLKNKYKIEHDVVNSFTLEDAFQRKLIEEIKKKELHGILYKDFESTTDIKDSSTWLKRGRLSPKTEGYLCNIQDRNIFYQKSKCHHCNKTTASVDHIATRCDKMLYFDYKKRHDAILKIILISILNKYTDSKVKHYKYQKTKSVYELDNIKILVDIPIKTDILITENRPDIVVIKNKHKEIYFIEIGITNQDNLNQTESYKKRKYELLGREYGRIMNMNVKIVPFVITWDGHVTTYNKKYRETLGITQEIFGYIQSVCLNKTFESLSNKRDLEELSIYL